MVAGFLAPLTTACGTDEKPDELRPVAAAARRDARDARRLAESTPGLSAQFELIAGVRGRHAKALQSEMDRLNPPEEDERRNRPVAPGRSRDPAELGQALREAQRAATGLATDVPAHRAGLLGAVAASCAGLRQLSAHLRSSEEDEPTLEQYRPDGKLDLPDEPVRALQRALAAEHAALWVYGLVSAFLPSSYDAGLDRAMTEHRSRRDATKRVLDACGATPRPAEPAYVPPRPVRDASSAMKVVITAETDAAVAWRGALERIENPDVRDLALRSLVGASARAARWRADAGITPSVLALPGKPEQG